MKAFGHFASAITTAWLWLYTRFHRTARPEGPVRRILVLGYAAIGDLIFFLPVLEALRRHYPQAKITFLANRYATSEELIPATGLVDDIWYVDWEGPGASRQSASINRCIGEAGFDLAVLTLSSPAHYFQWGLSRIPVRVGHCRALDAGRWRFKRALITGEFTRRALLNRVAWIPLGSEHALKRNLKLLDAMGLPKPEGLPRPRLPLSERHRARARELVGARPGRRLLGVHLGAPNNQYFKMWDPRRFGELLARLAQTGSLDVVLLGSADESPSAKVALGIFSGAKNLVGQTSLLETFAVIELCDLFLSNDTGLAKAAMALGIPTATIWGLSDPAEAGRIWGPERHLDIRTGIWCSPCARLGMARDGVLNYTNCGHHDCLAKLDVDFAFKAMRAKYSALLDG